MGATHLFRIESADLPTGSVTDAGRSLGTLLPGTRVRLAVITVPDVVPTYVASELAAPWRGVVCDPAPR